MSFDFDILFNLNDSQKELLRKITLNDLKNHIEHNPTTHYPTAINEDEAKYLYDLFNLSVFSDLGDLKVIQIELSGFIRS